MSGVRQTSSGVVQTASGLAQVLTVIDDFEDQDFGEYSSSTASNFSTTTNAAFHDTYGARYAATASDYLVSTSGLENYVGGGDTFRVACKTNDTSASNDGTYWFTVAWEVGGTDINNSENYHVLWQPGSGDLFLRERDTSGTTTELASTTVYSGVSDGEWVEIEVFNPSDPTSTSITAELFDSSDTSQGSVSSTTSTDRSNQGFGWHLNTNGSSVNNPQWDFDFARLV